MDLKSLPNPMPTLVALLTVTLTYLTFHHRRRLAAAQLAHSLSESWRAMLDRYELARRRASTCTDPKESKRLALVTFRVHWLFNLEQYQHWRSHVLDTRRFAQWLVYRRREYKSRVDGGHAIGDVSYSKGWEESRDWLQAPEFRDFLDALFSAGGTGSKSDLAALAAACGQLPWYSLARWRLWWFTRGQSDRLGDVLTCLVAFLLLLLPYALLLLQNALSPG